MPAITSGGAGDWPLARQAGGDPEARQPEPCRSSIDEHIRRLDVFVDDPPPVQSGERGSERDGEAEERRQGHRLADVAIQELTARVREQEYGPALVAHQRKRPNGPLRIQLVPQRILMFEPLQAPRFGVIRGRRQHQHRGRDASPLPPIEDELGVSPHDFQLPVGGNRHGSAPAGKVM